MGKTRKSGSSRHDRLFGCFDDYNSSSIHASSTGGGLELREEDVWGAVEDQVDCNETVCYGAPASDWRSASPSRTITQSRRWSRHVGGLSLEFKDGGSAQSSRIVRQYHQDNLETPLGRHVAESAPVNVPVWSMMNRVALVESEGDDDESEWIPPHEYLAREYARTDKMAATSVLEGVGRTLKGRDMSRVRDAVWSQTGFDG